LPVTLDSHGYRVHDDDDDDPVLLDSGGIPVDTWRENFPYDERMSRDEYEEQKRLLQIELLKLQKWSQANGHRHVIVFEGRDAAGKGGTIKRFMEHLNPRGARVVALEKPTDRDAPSGTSSVTSTTCRPTARSCCSTGPGTTGPASSG
jgi:polyphosphate kinase 2 (PPK2 family)